MKQKPKILIIDDKLANLISLERLLAKFEVEVHRALSGNEGLLLTLEHDFALAIIDIQMPEMDGYETVSLLREDERTKYLPVIFVSAIFKDDYYVIKGIESGAVDFITKPIVPEILGGKVKVFLDLYSQRHKLELINKELEDAKQKAESSTRAKSLFLANMSHEIRTPLNGIIGMADIINATDLSDEQKEYLDIITESGRNLLTIINDILDFSKVEAGQLELESIEFSLRKIVNEVVKLLSFKATEKNLYLESNIDHNVPDKFIGDPTRIKQVLINLMNNALKFTVKGGVKCNVKLIKTAEDSCELRFSIIDTGLGIKEENQDKLFQAFSQANSSITRTHGGTGLGLAICKNLVELMGGSIQFKSEYTRGSTFYFNALLKLGENAEENDPDKPNSNQSVHKKLRVLLADDNLINQKVASISIRNFGHSVDIAENGKVAVDLFNENSYDLIFMDIHMPEMNGIEATLKIREIEKGLNGSCSPTPIIALTASNSVEEQKSFIEAGMDACLSKPFKKEQLKEVLSQNCIAVIHAG
jgi:two-component system, sensor histidine kinase